MAENKVDAESLELRELCRENVRFLKLLNQLTLPVTYGDNYYRLIMGANATEEGPDVRHWNRLAFYRGAFVGAISCRLEATTSSSSEETCEACRVWLTTITTLPSFRRRGVGSVLLQAMLEMCRTIEGRVVGVNSVIRLHVQTSNEDAIAFYRRFGFAIVNRLEDYYGVRVEVRSAYVMELTLPLPTTMA